MDKLIEYLKNEIWFRVGQSNIHGVGLIAIRDIPKGTDILVEFKHLFGKKKFSIKKKKMLDIHPNIKKLWNDYWYNDTVYQEIYLPPNYKQLHVFYINHSNNPTGNLVCHDNHAEFVTIKDVKEGEEIFADYKRTL